MPRMDRMEKGQSRFPLTGTMRLFLRFVASLMVFAQLSAAAASCPDYLSAGHRSHHPCAQRLVHHQDSGDELCASDYLPANQMAATSPGVDAPTAPPITVAAATFPPAPMVQERPASPIADPVATVPRFLIFGRLLR